MILWLLAHLVMLRMQQQRHVSLLDYVDFLCLATWMSYHAARRIHQVETIYRYSRHCQLSRREPKERANLCRDGTWCGVGYPQHRLSGVPPTPLE